mgnify:CR=1 FL=1
METGAASRLIKDLSVFDDAKWLRVNLITVGTIVDCQLLALSYGVTGLEGSTSINIKDGFHVGVPRFVHVVERHDAVHTASRHIEETITGDAHIFHEYFDVIRDVRVTHNVSDANSYTLEADFLFLEGVDALWNIADGEDADPVEP